VPEDGQRWTTLADLRADHVNRIREDGALVGIGTEPEIAIGQRALLVPHNGSNLLWDCITLLDDETVAEVERRGGLAGIAVSHPHFYSAMVEWADAFDCPIHLHESNRDWVMRPDPRIELWSGDTLELGDGATLIRCGGHFPGATVLHWGPGSAILVGDVVMVVPDRRWVSFMYSFPNLIPLGEEAVRGVAAALDPFPFEHIYGGWWGRNVRRDGHGAVQRSAARYVRALRGELP
jgi:glyoxylase-like metal-dependent hydrolase (beta-lactamase superfamily II)